MKLIKTLTNGSSWMLNAETATEAIALRQFLKQIGHIGKTKSMSIIAESGVYKNTPHTLYINFIKK